MDIRREQTTQEQFIKLASDFIGTQEIKGREHSHVIMDMFNTLGHTWVTTDETSWCTAFINWLGKSIGVDYSKKLNARSYLDVGEATESPIPGDIVVFWRESLESWKGHVGIFMGYNKDGNVFCLGGNQNNEVNITLYSKDRVLGFRQV